MKEQAEEAKRFRNRQIICLKLPTYFGMKKVMFYDVLMKLTQ